MPEPVKIDTSLLKEDPSAPRAVSMEELLARVMGTQQAAVPPELLVQGPPDPATAAGVNPAIGMFGVVRPQMSELGTAAAGLAAKQLPIAGATAGSFLAGGTVPLLVRTGAAMLGAAAGSAAEQGVEASVPGLEGPGSFGEAAQNVGIDAIEQGAFEAIPGMGRAALRKVFSRGLQEETKFLSTFLGKPVTQKEFLDWAATNGMHVTLPEAVEGRSTKLLQHLAETNLIGMAIAGKSWKATVEAGSKLLRDTQRSFGVQLTAEEVGETLHGSLGPIKNKVFNRFHNAYESIFMADPYATVNLSDSIPKIGEKLMNLVEVGKTAPILQKDLIEAVSRYKEFLQTAGLFPSSHEIPLPLAQKIRTSLWQASKESGLSKFEQTAVRDAFEAVDKAMSDELAHGSTPGTAKNWRAVNAAYKAWISDLTVAENVVKDTYEKTGQAQRIGQLLGQASDRRSDALNRVFKTWGKDNEARDAIRLGFLNQIIGDVNDLGDKFVAGGRLKNVLLRIGPNAAQTMFGNDLTGRVAYDNLVKLAEVEARAPRMMNPSMTSGSLRAHWNLIDMISAGLQIGAAGVGARIATKEGGEGSSRYLPLVGIGAEAALAMILFSPRATRSLSEALTIAPYSSSQATTHVIRAIQMAFSEPNLKK